MRKKKTVDYQSQFLFILVLLLFFFDAVVFFDDNDYDNNGDIIYCLPIIINVCAD